MIEKSTAKFRDAIYKKYNNLCPLCGESLHNGETIELHHILSIKEGGKYSMNNIQPLHQICHVSITHKSKLN
jgi:RNA-directed DNA polymerase